MDQAALEKRSDDHPPKSHRRRHRRILMRTIGMSWAMILLTVAVFLFALIPYQRQQLVAEMNQRAQVVYTSTAQVAMESILLQDLSAVVDHCMSIVDQNPSLIYVVLTRSDGFSLLHTRKWWKQETLSGFWMPTSARTIGQGRFMTNPLGEDEIFHISYRFEYMGVNWGWIHLGLSTKKFRKDSLSLYQRSFMIATLAISAGFILSLIYARRLSVPILQLEAFARKIAGGDLSERIHIHSGDEVEQLAESFNFMVDELQRANAERQITQKKMLDTARQAGMAETVINVLHNVGNVLNSVGVTTTTMKTRIEHSRLESLVQVAALLEEQKTDLAGFFANDSRSGQIPDYLSTLGDYLISERKSFISDLGTLERLVGHVRDIIHLQQDYSRASGMVESVGIRDVIEDALQLNSELSGKHQIQITTTLEDLPDCWVDRHKLMQILINLISNAQHALAAGEVEQKTLLIRLKRVTDNQIRIEVTDNGMGIDPENLTRIFQHGFTTRPNGHGFGLHSSAIAAREMGGTLTASSRGIGYGATFILLLPYRPMEAPDEKKSPS